jgi:CheY-like chemotaxis protein
VSRIGRRYPWIQGSPVEPDGKVAVGSVLIVEDDEDTRASLTALIESRGYEVVTAANGEQALEVLKSETVPRLVILDLVMPGMTGWQVRVEFLAQMELWRIPVVLSSGLEDVAQHAKILGAVDYLKKPIDIDKLFGIVDTYCREAEAS